MIFLSHMMQAMAFSLALIVAYRMTKNGWAKKHRLLATFLIFFGIAMFIHFLMDCIANPKEMVIRCYLNLEPCTYELEKLIKYFTEEFPLLNRITS